MKYVKKLQAEASKVIKQTNAPITEAIRSGITLNDVIPSNPNFNIAFKGYFVFPANLGSRLYVTLQDSNPIIGNIPRIKIFTSPYCLNASKTCLEISRYSA